MPSKPSTGAISGAVILSVIAGLLWVLSLATLASLGNSDAAGNAIGEAYAAIQIIALWSLLTIMTIIAGVKGAAPKPAKVAALVVVPASGFVAMAAADLLVGKAGGLTTSEALARHLPMALIEPIPGQEFRNADHLLEGGAAIRCNNLPAAAWKIAQLFDDPSRLDKMRQAAATMAHPNAAANIAEDALRLLH